MQGSSLQNLAGFRCSQLAAQKMLKCQATIKGQQQAAAHQPCLPPPPLPPLPAAAAATASQLQRWALQVSRRRAVGMAGTKCKFVQQDKGRM